MLELNVTKTVEAVLVSISKHTKRIEESKRWLGSELRLESVQSSNRGSFFGTEAGAKKQQQNQQKDSSDSEFHFEVLKRV